MTTSVHVTPKRKRHSPTQPRKMTRKGYAGTFTFSESSHMTIISTQLPSPIFTFDNEDQHHAIRTTRDAVGQLWFVAQDACTALGLTNTARALSRLDADEKGKTILSTPGGKQQFSTISEAGLNRLAMRSNKPIARAFQRWLAHSVIPAIARDGLYVFGEERLPEAATIEELQSRLAGLQAIASQGLEAKASRGLNALEEREARRDAFKFLSRGRRRTKRLTVKQLMSGGAA
jgi:prophage antirepressor-like protein